MADMMPADQAAKERPILMSAPMVRAILAGTKTQTRRVVKPHKAFEEWGVKGPDDAYDATTDDDGQGFFLVAGDHGYAGPVPCPYGQPGDRLWVRETFKAIASGEVKNGYGEVRYGFAYQADGATTWQERPTIIHDLTGQPATGALQFKPVPWKSSIHMPRRASRITLEIVSVRVERLNDISEADAHAEGTPHSMQYASGRLASENFAHLWECINGDDSWDANPWVWVVEFRRLP